MLVVDANVIADAVAVAPHPELGARLYRCDPAWVGPPLWRSELRSVVARQARLGLIDDRRALGAMRRAELLVRDADVTLDSAPILELARTSRCSVYDCEYVLAALQLRVPLVTRDRAVLRAFPSLALTPEAAVARFE